MELKNCKCGGVPISKVDDSVAGIRVWVCFCHKCGIFIYAPTQEQAETIWNDAMEAAELREKMKEVNLIVKSLRSDIESME
jgi:hypothetical protein